MLDSFAISALSYFTLRYLFLPSKENVAIFFISCFFNDLKTRGAGTMHKLYLKEVLLRTTNSSHSFAEQQKETPSITT